MAKYELDGGQKQTINKQISKHSIGKDSEKTSTRVVRVKLKLESQIYY